MNQQEFDIKTEEKTPTNVSDFRLREKSFDNSASFLVIYLPVMGQQLRKRLKRERRVRYNKRVKARAAQAKKA